MSDRTDLARAMEERQQLRRQQDELKRKQFLRLVRSNPETAWSTFARRLRVAVETAGRWLEEDL